MKNNSKLKTKQSGKTNKRKKELAEPSLGTLSQTVQHSLLLVHFFQLIEQACKANSTEIPYVGNECFKEWSQILTQLPICISRLKTELTSCLLLLTFRMASFGADLPSRVTLFNF